MSHRHKVESTWSLVRSYSIKELIDSLCRDGMNAQYMQISNLYNFTTNILKAYTFIINCPAFQIECSYDQTLAITQKPHGRQLSTKVSGSERTIFYSFFVQPAFFNNDSSKVVQVFIIILVQTDAYHSTELYDHIAS